MIEIIESRKTFAKFLGLALFKVGLECLKRLGPFSCGISGPCCKSHRLEGLKEAHELFPKLFEPFGIKFDKIDATSDTFFMSILAIYADFKTQIIVNDLIVTCSASSASSTNGLAIRLENLLEIYFGPAMNLNYLKTKLQQRAIDLRRILEQGISRGDLEDVLNSKFPGDLFESNLKNVLRNVYGAFPETFLSEIVSKATGNGASEPMKLTEPMSLSAATETKKISAPAETKKISASAETKAQTMQTPLTKPETCVTEPAEPSPFKDVIISGKFFRGVLEPVDERFAAIIEGRDVGVKQYLQNRKRRSNQQALSAKKTKASKSANDEIDIAAKSSLLERHDSAERISWETQPEIDIENSSSSSSDDEISFQPRNAERDSETRKVADDTAAAQTAIRPIEKSSSSTSRIGGVQRNGRVRGRRPFEEWEIANLIDGIRKYGRDWRRILNTYKFNDRSNVDLKDKARHLERMNEI